METNHHFHLHHHHHHHHLLLLLIIITATLPTTTRTQTLPPSPSPSPSSLPPSSASPQLNNIIDALIGAGDFSIWVNILSMSNPTLLPVSVTLFIPQDTTLNKNGVPMIDPFLFPYHVVPQRLTFSDLLLFRPNSRLPTLLPGKSISVTFNSAGNFSIDGTPVTHPDLYSTSNVAVHGVAAVLDYSLFGEGVPPPPPPPPPAMENGLPPPFMPIGEAIGANWRSGGPASGYDSLWCTSVHVAFLMFFLLLQELVFLFQMINV